MKEYQVTVEEEYKLTTHSSESWRGDTITKVFSSIAEVQEYFIDLIGKVPDSKTKKMYVDREEGTVIQVGYVYSKWVTDIVADRSFWITYWITIEEIERKRILLDDKEPEFAFAKNYFYVEGD